MKKFLRIIAYILLGLLVLIGIVYGARVPLVNYGLKQIPAELGIKASIESIDLSLLRRSVFIGGVRVRLTEPDLQLSIGDIALTGIVAKSAEEAGFDALQIKLVDVTLNDAQQTIKAQLRGIELAAASYLSGDVQLARVRVNGVATQLSQWPQPDATIEDLRAEQIEYLAAGQVKVGSVTVNTLAAQAKALAKNLNIQHLALDKVQFVIDTLSTKLTTASLSGLVYADATAKPDQPPMVNLGTLTVSGIDAPKPSSIHIDNILFPGGELYVVRDAEGNINLLPPMAENQASNQADQQAAGSVGESGKAPAKAPGGEKQSTPAAAAEVPTTEQAAVTDTASTPSATPPVTDKTKVAKTKATENAAASEAGLSWSLLGFQLAAPLRIHFADYTLVPALEETITFNEITLAHAHNAPTGEPLTAKIRADIGKAGKLKLDASALLATATETFDVDLEMNHVELPGLSGFSQQATGYAIESGQASLDVKLKARKKQLQGEAIADLYRVVLRVEDAETSEKLTQELTMPLPTTLYLLQDDDEHIKMNIPIEGDMDNPDFSPSGFVALVTKKALKKASVYYLKNALFPGNLLIDAVSLVGGSVYGKLTAVPPMEFTPASPELSPANAKTLGQLVTLLTKKKKLTVRLCSVAVAADGEDKKSALKLAGQRRERARQWLVEHQITPSRLLACLPRYDEEAQKPLLLMQL